MKIKALVSFAGVLSMAKGEVREYDNEVILQNLLKCGYVKEVKKGGGGNESKRDNSK